MKTKLTSRLARTFAIAMVICLMACFMLTTTTLAANDAVTATSKGVVQINLVYTDDFGAETTVSSGTAFLINDTTLLTCHHVVALSSEDLATLSTKVGKTATEVQNRLSISVTVNRDMTIPATYINGSAEVDFAIIRMSQSMPTKAPLALRKSSEVVQTESVWTVGFPVMDTLLQSYNTFTENDVNIANGTVTKIAVGTNMYSGANTEYIQTNCNMDMGNSGGPMVDENGNVIGISQGVWTWGDTSVSTAEYYNAIAIDEVITALDSLGITYSIKNGSASTDPQPNEPQPSEPQPTEPSVTQPTEKPQDTVEDPLPSLDNIKNEKNSTMWIIIVAAVVVVIIIVVIVVVVLVGGKKKASAPAAPMRPAAPAAPVPPIHPVAQSGNGGFAPPTTYPVQDAGETTVLSGGNAGETTVLSRNAVNGGSLLRKRTGENVAINAEQFVIGRERKSVNYCISDNSSISRNHVRLTVRSGVTYLTDLNAANGTFVNGVKVMPRQEVALKNGDKITLADEDLEYKN